MDLFEKTKRGLRCNLCPHFCVLKKNEIGKCHARFSDGGKISHIKLPSNVLILYIFPPEVAV